MACLASPASALLVIIFSASTASTEHLDHVEQLQAKHTDGWSDDLPVETFSATRALDTHFMEDGNATSLPLNADNSDVGSTNESSETIDPLNEERLRALKDDAFLRKTVQYPTCCRSEGGCDERDCQEILFDTVKSQATARRSGLFNETESILMCVLLMKYVETLCNDTNASYETLEECNRYCRCIGSSPEAEAADGVMSALQVVFLLLTLCVYAAVPRLRNLHGKFFMSYLLALTVVAIIATIRRGPDCYLRDHVVDSVSQYFSLARFFWINVMCFDIYRTCRLVQSVRHGTTTSVRFRIGKFSYYSMAAWGVPAILVGTLQLASEMDRQVTYIVMAFLSIAASCIPLTMTLTVVWVRKRAIKKRYFHISERKLNWFYLCFKLLCVSGVGKICSVIAYVSLRRTSLYGWLFVVLKLEGPLIFILFACNDRVKDLIRKRLYELEWISTEKSTSK